MRSDDPIATELIDINLLGLLAIVVVCFFIPKGIGRGNGAKEKLKNVAEIPVTNKEYNDDFMKERADIIGKEMEGLNSSPMVIALVSYVSFATLVKGDTSPKSVNFRTLITPAGNDADVFVSKESVCVVKEWLNNIVYGFFLGKRVAYPIVILLRTTHDGIHVGEWASYARAMVELRANVELKDTIVVDVSKFFGEGFL
ncbi:hypothetical protein Tco_1480216, partial [Tanacetum coccineum]